MIRVPMLDNILGQVESLRSLLSYQAGGGKPALEDAGRLLRECSGQIIVTGMGASLFAALPAVQALEAHGRPVRFTESSELLHYGRWQKNDVAILISRSGGSIETLELGRHMKEAGLRIIAVTNVLGSRLTQLADVVLWIGSEADQLIAVKTYTGTVVALLLLAEQALTSPVEHNLSAECAAALPALKRHIDLSLTRSDSWRNFFLGPTPLYLLGRGSALAAVAEGALLFHETAKAATVGMSSGQFRHGPVEVVSREFRAVILGTSDQTSEIDWQLARDLNAMNASVRWLGSHPETSSPPQVASRPQPVPQPGSPPQQDPDNFDLLPWPAAIPSALLPVFDIVPLQVAAYRTAEWRGLRPGDFRYASEVTEKESGFPLFEASLT